MTRNEKRLKRHLKTLQQLEGLGFTQTLSRTLIPAVTAWLGTIVLYLLVNLPFTGALKLEESVAQVNAAWSQVSASKGEVKAPKQPSTHSTYPTLKLEYKETSGEGLFGRPVRSIEAGFTTKEDAPTNENDRLTRELVSITWFGWPMPSSLQIRRRTPLDAVMRMYEEQASGAGAVIRCDTSARRTEREKGLCEHVGRLQSVFDKNIGHVFTAASRSAKVNGPIQFLTVWLGLMALIWMHRRHSAFVGVDRLLSKLDRITTPEGDDVAIPWRGMRREQAKDLRAVHELYERVCDGLGRSLGTQSMLRYSPLLEFRRSAYAAASTSNDLSDVPQFVSTIADTHMASIESANAIIRYLIWVIPIVGFIGTVLGIGDALLLTANLQNANPEVTVTSRIQVSEAIGVAFDTTFIALVVSAIVMFVYFITGHVHEKIVQMRAQEAIWEVVSVDNARHMTVEQERLAENVPLRHSIEPSQADGLFWGLLLIAAVAVIAYLMTLHPSLGFLG